RPARRPDAVRRRDRRARGAEVDPDVEDALLALRLDLLEARDRRLDASAHLESGRRLSGLLSRSPVSVRLLSHVPRPPVPVPWTLRSFTFSSTSLRKIAFFSRYRGSPDLSPAGVPGPNRDGIPSTP